MIQLLRGIRADFLRKRGLKKLFKGDYQKAGIYLRKALQLADNTENRFNLGLYHLNRHNLTEAEKTFIEISRDYPDHEINGLLLFESYMLQEKWEAAQEQIELLCRLNPTAVKYQILKNTACDVISREKYKKVKILKSEAQQMLADKKHQAALDNYLKAEQYSPSDPEIINNIGSIYLRAKVYTKAYNYFEKALKLEPENQIVKKNLVVTKNRLRKNRKKL